MLGNVLKLIRISNSMDLNDVAIQTNLLPDYIQNIESNKVKITLSRLGMFSNIYQMPISQILIFSDMQEHFGVSDITTLKDIERYYVCKQDVTKSESYTLGR